MPEQTPAFDPLFDSELIRRALAEDIGRGDVTTEATIPADVRLLHGSSRERRGVVAGLPVAQRVFAALDPNVRFEAHVADGDAVEAGATLAQISGEARALLTSERVALNFLGRLSGIATLTARCVAAIKDTRTQIVETRKRRQGCAHWRSMPCASVAGAIIAPGWTTAY